jgi:hypothetical protein
MELGVWPSRRCCAASGSEGLGEPGRRSLSPSGSSPARGPSFPSREVVPQSGIYTITHHPAHADMPHEVTVIKGRRFPTCRIARASVSSSRMRPSMSARSIISSANLQACAWKTGPRRR